MGKRQKQWARTKRAYLVRVLKSKCCDCGTTKNLEFDCIEPQGHKHHGYSTDQRISFYMSQLWKGNLALRCSRCNALKSDRSESEWLSEAPRLLGTEWHPSHTDKIAVVNEAQCQQNPF